MPINKLYMLPKNDHILREKFRDVGKYPRERSSKTLGKQIYFWFEKRVYL